MKLRWLLVFLPVFLLMLVLAGTVRAEDKVPTPYAGMKNPYPWGDTTAQSAGKKLYQQSCTGCHGSNGANIKTSDFSTADFKSALEARPDYYYWILSEGRLNKGMPPYKSSLSEEQRWQVTTYLGSLAKPPETAPPPAGPPPASGNIYLTVAKQKETTAPLTLIATLQDKQGKPIENALVKFYVEVSFFGHSLMELDDAVTNEQGVAATEFTPRSTGETTIIAKSEGAEASIKVQLTGSAQYYHPEVGLRLPTVGKEIFVGPASSHELSVPENAPMTALRLPGGTLSWLLLFVGVLVLFWGAYSRILFNIFRISRVQSNEAKLWLVPVAGILLVLFTGTMLVLMVITGPYSHFHLSP